MVCARSIWAAVAASLLARLATAQTTTSCNPTQTSESDRLLTRANHAPITNRRRAACDPDDALGMAVDVDFTQGEVNSFTSSGGSPTYDSDGVTFTITKQGDAPQLNSLFYIMFGKVEITMKCATGTGIVSSVVLESDDLDEIDMEFLGVRPEEMQAMYFGQGESPDDALLIVSTPDNQADFVTYTVDWSANRIIWSVAGSQVRVLEFNDANGYYPQTPMRLKFGAWAGGDSSNAAGTISWAGGQTDYSQGPFSMTVQSVAVTDYSTGTQYKYGNTNGTWQSIESVGGEINANADDAATPTEISGSSTTGTSFPDSGIASATSTATTDITSIPSGWHMTSEGKIVPNGAKAMGMCSSRGAPGTEAS